VKDRFAACIVDAETRALQTILRDYDCRELVNEKEELSTGTDGWRIREFTPCHYACKHGHADILEMLIVKGGANPNIAADFGLTPAMVAVEQGHDECLLVLLKDLSVEEINQPDVSGRTCFWLAAYHGQVECLHLLVSHGCQVNVRDTQGRSAVHAAARSADNEDALRFVCAIGSVDINRPDRDGSTPLDVSPPDSVNSQILRDAGAKPTAENEQAEDLRRAAMHNDNELIAQLLNELECRGIIDVPDPDWTDWRVKGFCALQYAAVAGNVQAVKLLIQHGANADVARDDEGNCALLLACARGKVSVLLELLAGANSDKTNLFVVNKAGQGAVYCAVAGNQRECLAILLREDKIDFNRADDLNNMAPLHIACQRNYEQCAKMLLDAGALVNARDKDGSTPWQYAAQDSLKRLLRARGGL
jgi:ankyrin repeat protein